MFKDAAAFNQDLGWCVVNPCSSRFVGTACAVTSCGVVPGVRGGVMDDTTHSAAVTLVDDPTSAESTYGHISGGRRRGDGHEGLVLREFRMSM